MDETSINPTSPIEKDRQIAQLKEEIETIKESISSLEKLFILLTIDAEIGTDKSNIKILTDNPEMLNDLAEMEKEARQLIEDAAKETKEERVAPI